nr:S-invertase, beta-D-fructofuranoside fructohydrolase=60 kda high molecular weight isoform {N-terminal} {EC 3.2.1.26} [Aspergillus nidulans, Eidam, 2.1, Peptide Partial, 15 aa] [Aspergillus nidulans]
LQPSAPGPAPYTEPY